MDLLKTIEQLEQKYKDLTSKIAEQEVIQNIQLYNELSKQHSELMHIIELGKKYRDTLHEIEDAKIMIEEESNSEMVELAQNELTTLEKQAIKIENQLHVALIPDDPDDKRNVIMEIRAGTGGEEAALFASELFRMYARFAENKKWTVEIYESNDTGKGGIKEIVYSIQGYKCYSFLKYESGIHRVQRVPETEASGRLHTSAATVAVLPEVEPVDVEIDPADLRIDTFRASGAGGQHVNKVESAIRITHIPTNIVVSCQDEKSQHKNKKQALKVLASRLYELKKQERDDEISSMRRDQVGSGDRSGRIRTYNYPQNRITDHRLNLTLYKLDRVLEGDLDEIIQALAEDFKLKQLQKMK